MTKAIKLLEQSKQLSFHDYTFNVSLVSTESSIGDDFHETHSPLEPKPSSKASSNSSKKDSKAKATKSYGNERRKDYQKKIKTEVRRCLLFRPYNFLLDV
mgnify:CR=1 FL=1